MSIFFEGDLQGAIALSLQSKKDFAAFIYATDEEDDDAAALSQVWENETFSDEIVRNYFALSSIFLKIRQNSVEYGHLSALVSDIKVPSVVILRQGQVQHNFGDVDALLQHCRLFNQAVQWQRQAAGQNTAAQSAEPTPAVAPGSVSSPVNSQPSVASASSFINNSPSTTTAVHSPQSQLLPQVLQPTPTEPLPATTDEPAPPQTSRGQPSVQRPLQQSSLASENNATQSWAAQQRQRNLEARRERERVLAQIEDDKRARKAREAERKNLASQGKETASSPDRRKSPAKGTSCGIQIRLISGRTIRRTFDASATPASDLRPWIDEELANDHEGMRVPAYRLKRMGIPPAPTREIGLSEEAEPFSELDLLPSATLVVTPIHGAADAYSESGNGSGWGLFSLPGAIVGGAASMAAGAVGAVGGALSNTFGFGASAASVDSTSNEERPSAPANAARVRTLYEVRREDGREDGREDQDFYNGNQLNFQSNDSDDR